ncbi:hypothetical protein HETIRDRAFT_106977 [Heterobasidion irregulare TC 32-1]|uniref:Uncharacterized protein n=1 Tax=Heterobasidion irregulare (strain TC 32-1) TaxID=747525 RepID=W4KAJ0_HETIT|nr:uncharacterized protein HETIRDRAFT_106977 [Heterobasidion irregulare TC 32-1]ETW82793.1 hypothetical protein HETIRDRAFT_106977 [Heterobasidion irregulare TC 32-1]
MTHAGPHRSDPALPSHQRIRLRIRLPAFHPIHRIHPIASNPRPRLVRAVRHVRPPVCYTYDPAPTPFVIHLLVLALARAPCSPAPSRHPTSSHLPPSTSIHLRLHLTAPILQHRPFDRPPRTRLVRTVHRSSLARHSSLRPRQARPHSPTPRAHSPIGALR